MSRRKAVEAFTNLENARPETLEIQTEIARLNEQFREGIDKLGGSVALIVWTPAVGLKMQNFPDNMGIGTHATTGEIRLRAAQLPDLSPEQLEDMRHMLDFMLDSLARTHKDLQVCKGQLIHVFGNKDGG